MTPQLQLKTLVIVKVSSVLASALLQRTTCTQCVLLFLQSLSMQLACLDVISTNFTCSPLVMLAPSHNSHCAVAVDHQVKNCICMPVPQHSHLQVG